MVLMAKSIYVLGAMMTKSELFKVLSLMRSRSLHFTNVSIRERAATTFQKKALVIETVANGQRPVSTRCIGLQTISENVEAGDLVQKYQRYLDEFNLLNNKQRDSNSGKHIQ